MASVVTEHVILLIPGFFAMMIFALVANAVVINYSAQQRAIVIDGAENQLSTTISQLFSTMSQTEIQACNITKSTPLPELIDGQNYSVNGTLNGNILTLTFNFPGIPLKDNTMVNLGPKAQWETSSILTSTNRNAVIRMEKYYNTTVGDVRIKIGFR
jgi:hypothetical protein